MINLLAVLLKKREKQCSRVGFSYLRQLRDFWIRIPGIPQIGTYTVNVTVGKKKGSAADIQAVVKTIPLPEVKYFSPRDGAVLNSANPTVSWKAVKSKDPLYYRLEINELNGGRIYSTGYVLSMQSHTVPSGLLKSGQSYRWRIRISDDDNWEKVQNRSHCAWQNFHIR